MIIGITGLAGSGKSEVAAALREFGHFKRFAFADALKDMLAAAGFTHAQLYGADKGLIIPEFGCSSRHVMQTLGTEWGRDLIHPDIWVRLWERRVSIPLSKGAHIVADDVRFPNEVATIRAMGGQVWRVTRPGVQAMDHVSESQLFDVDVTLNNTASLHDLRQVTLEAYREAKTACG